MSGPPHLEFVALGGLGEFGMNMMLYRSGRDCLLVDAGVMFPGESHLGIDVVVPDFAGLVGCGTIHGVLLTHGHEDHIGAVPHLLGRHDLPLYATPYTRDLIRRRLRMRGESDDVSIQPLPGNGEVLRLGPFAVETIATAHSIPEARMLVLRTPAGTVVHTADFKLDPDPPDDASTDLGRLEKLAREPILALLSDSTNADRPGWTPSERSVANALDPLVSGATGRVVVTTFASHIGRISLAARLAARHGRRLAIVGASIESQVEIAEQHGLLRFPAGLRVAVEDVASLPPERVLVVASGTQGEPASALARIAVGKHRFVAVEQGDRVVHSARRIPGNEKSIARMINHLLRRGAEVITEQDAAVHVSGHAAADELRRLIDLLRPRFLVPIHGEYRQLLAHARIARDCGMDPSRVRLVESGELVSVSHDRLEVVGHVQVGQVFVDADLDEVDGSLLRERRRLAGDGIVVPVVAVNQHGVLHDGFPEIVTRGFAPEGNDLLEATRRALVDSLATTSPEERGDEGLLRARVQTTVRRHLRRHSQRRPLVIPIILEL